MKQTQIYIYVQWKNLFLVDVVTLLKKYEVICVEYWIGLECIF